MKALEGGTEVELAGLRLRNPLVVASGVLGVSVGLMVRAEKAGAGAITTKTTTLEPRAGNPNPVVYDLGYGLLNSMGLPNPGAAQMGEVIREAKSRLTVPIIASIGAASPSEAVNIAEHLLLADALELNASCPHAKGLGVELMADPLLISKIVSELKNLSKPVFVKVSAHGDYVRVAGKALEGGADAVVAINTLKGMVIDVWAKKPVLGGIYGGLSGRAIHPVAVRVVYELHREYPDVPIVGVGGVESWVEAVELMLAGATAVGIASALKKGFSVIGEILDGIKRYLSEEGFKSVKELVGAAH